MNGGAGLKKWEVWIYIGSGKMLRAGVFLRSETRECFLIMYIHCKNEKVRFKLVRVISITAALPNFTAGIKPMPMGIKNECIQLLKLYGIKVNPWNDHRE